LVSLLFAGTPAALLVVDVFLFGVVAALSVSQGNFLAI
jgi:hypothetical protein